MRQPIQNHQTRRKHDQLQDMKVNPQPASTPAETDAYLAAEMKRWASTIESANIKIN